MLQDIRPHRYDNRYFPDAPCKEDSLSLFGAGDSLLFPVESGAYLLPVRQTLPAALLARTDRMVYLFALDDRAVFLVPEAFAEGESPPAHTAFLSSQELRRAKDFSREEVFVLLTALHLARWYAENRFCGSCGTGPVYAKDERAIDCPSCRRRIYPKIMPAVIVGVTKGDEIVLTRYANRPFAYHALIAGFNEIGETLEDTVRREVMEEVGLSVTNIRYYKSQPWALAGDILAGFYCDVTGDDTIHVDQKELKEAVWVKRVDIDGQPDDFSLTNEMMMVFKEGREPR